MASFKAKFPVLQELFAKNHRGGPLGPPSGARDISRNSLRASRSLVTIHRYVVMRRGGSSGATPVDQLSSCSVIACGLISR